MVSGADSSPAQGIYQIVKIRLAGVPYFLVFFFFFFFRGSPDFAPLVCVQYNAITSYLYDQHLVFVDKD